MPKYPENTIGSYTAPAKQASNAKGRTIALMLLTQTLVWPTLASCLKDSTQTSPAVFSIWPRSSCSA